MLIMLRKPLLVCVDLVEHVLRILFTLLFRFIIICEGSTLTLFKINIKTAG